MGVDTTPIRNCAGSIEAGASEVARQLTEIANAYEQLRPAFQGDAANRQQALFAEWKQSADALQSIMPRMAENLVQIAVNYEKADAANLGA